MGIAHHDGQPPQGRGGALHARSSAPRGYLVQLLRIGRLLVSRPHRCVLIMSMRIIKRVSPPAPMEVARRTQPGRCGAVVIVLLTACKVDESPLSPVIPATPVFGPPAQVALFPPRAVLGPDGDSLTITAVVEDSEGRSVPGAQVFFDQAGGKLDETRVQSTNSQGVAEVVFHASADAMVCATVFPRPEGATTPDCVLPAPVIIQTQMTGDCTDARASDGDAGTSDGNAAGSPAGFAVVFVQVQRPIICAVLPTSVSWNAGQALSLWIGGTGFAAQPTVFVGGQQAAVTSPGTNGMEVVIVQPASVPKGMQSIIVSNPASGYTYVWSSPGLIYLP